MMLDRAARKSWYGAGERVIEHADELTSLDQAIVTAITG